MCGICGKLSFTAKTVEPEMVRNISARLTHRGPDAEGFYFKPNIGLGQRRLSIIDLNPEATPPLTNETGDVWVVFNGEIYNFQELREDLVGKGHHFRTRSDTEVILHLYEEYGEAAVDWMRGMFVFALWDEQRQRLFIARDRLGKKPLFYAKTPYGLTFASEVQALRGDTSITFRPDLSAIDSYLTWQCVPAGLSAFEGVASLPAAHTLGCSADGTLEIRRYWSPPVAQPVPMTMEEAGEQTLAALREAVRLRTVADVPLGAFLSGGIDSGLIVALLSEVSSGPVKTVTIGFGESPETDERIYARLVAERFSTDHSECELAPITADAFDSLVRSYGQPFADSSAYPTYAVSRAARQRVTVALSGDGGDESFGGYAHYAQQLRWTVFDGALGPLARLAGSAGGRLANRVADKSWRWARIERGFRTLAEPLEGRYDLQMQCLKPQERRLLYTARFKTQLAATGEPPISRWMERAPGETPLDYMMRHDQGHYLPDCLMTKTDIASMACSLEVRCPFLDQKLVEFASTIPHTLKSDGKTGKLVLRSIARKMLPEAIVNKKKSGFSIPLRTWFAGPMKPLLLDLVSDSSKSLHQFVHKESMERMIQQQFSGERSWENRLWALMFLNVWLRQNSF